MVKKITQLEYSAFLSNLRPFIKVALILKKLDMHGSILSTVATDALVLNHQAISIYSNECIFIVLDQFHTEILQL